MSRSTGPDESVRPSSSDSEPDPSADADQGPADDASWVRRFRHLAAINILANVTVPLVGLVDTAMLGHLDDIRFLAGVALGAIIFDYIFWTMGFLRMATTGLTAQAVGRREPVEAERVLRRSIGIALAAGAVLLLVREPLADFAFGLLSGDAGTEAAGREYFFARLWGAPAALVNLAFLGWFLGREESRVALVMTVVANTANLVLDYVFILRWGWNAAGAGYAGAAGQYLMATVAVIFYLRRRRPVGSWADLWRKETVRQLFSLNRDIIIRTLCLGTAFALFTDFSSGIGTDVLAANTLHLRILALFAFFVDGIAFAVESLAGIFHGEKRYGTLDRLMRLALWSGVFTAAGFAFAVCLAPDLIFGLLTSHDDVVTLAASYRGWLIPVLLLGSVAYVLDGLFIGLTAGRELRNAMVLSFAAFLPAALWGVHTASAHWLWAGLACFMAARVLTLGRRWPKLYP